MANNIKHAFEHQLVNVAIAELLPIKILSARTRKSQKFAQILASIRAVGIIEPPVVVMSKEKGKYILLDGHMRVVALQELKEERVSCLVSTDDESYTYNKYISKLSPIQAHRMIIKAIEKGVSEEKLAAALNRDIHSIHEKTSMLQGVCTDAVEMLKDKQMSEKVFRILKKMKPVRQVRVSQIMNDQNRYSYNFANSLLVGTPPDQLVPGTKTKTLSRGVLEKRLRLEEENLALTDDLHSINQTYGTDMLKLSGLQSYLKTMINNEKVAAYLQKFHPLIFKKFSEIMNLDFMKLKIA